MSNTKVIEILSEYIRNTQYEEFPREVIGKTKEIILDTIGVGLLGLRTDPGKIVVDVIKDLGGVSESTIIGDGSKVSCIQAGYVNSYLVDVLDFEETYEGLCHPNSSVVPACLAIGEKMCSTGKEIITATVLGNEVAIRIGLAMMPSREVTDTGVNAYTWHCYGSAAASSKLLNLHEEQIIHTFGITGSNSPLPTTVTKMGRPLSYVKNNFQRMTDAGILGALLAQKGFLGLTKIMDSDAGFWKMSGSDRYDVNRVQYGLGKEYEILKIGFKPYPACRWIHSILDATYDLFWGHAMKPGEIKEINVYTVSDMVRWFVDYEPNSLIDAEFSVPYTVAMIILGVEPGLEWFDEHRLRDPEVLALTRKVHVYANPQDDQAFYQSSANMANATVEIVMKDGEKVKKGIDLKHDHLRGSAKRPIDVKKKAKHCALSAGMKEKQLDEIISIIDHLEDVDNISRLTELFNIC